MMDVSQNISVRSSWERFWFSKSLYPLAKIKSWNLMGAAKQPSSGSRATVADLDFIMRSETRNLKHLFLSEDAKESYYQWRNCMISILECRKALHESQNAESQEKLRIEYFALKEQRKHLRKRYRVLKVQCHKPIKAHITQLQKIKNHIVQASGQTYLSLRIEFYLVLTEAKNMLQANMLGSTDDLY